MYDRGQKSEVNKLLLVIYCHIRWRSNYCREFYYALAKEMDGKGQVCCIDRPLALVPDIILRPYEVVRSLWKKRIIKISSNLTLYQPILFLNDQLALFSRILSRLNRWFLRRQILKRFDGFYGDSRLFTYIVEPCQYDYLKLFDIEISIYDCIAEWASYPGLSYNEQEKRRFYENKTVNEVDIVFAVSEELSKRRKRIKEAVHYLPWAAEYDHFTRGMDNDKCPDLLKHKKPFIGFIGNIWGIFDIDLIKQIAESLPDCSVILIGGLSQKLPSGFKKKFEEICLIDSVHWLGYKEHDILPDYLHYLDVCIMPYLVDDWIRTCSPGKFYQYLAQGKPVVSVEIPEVARYSDKDIVRIARDPDDFVEKVKEALKQRRTEDLEVKRQNIARENTWHVRASKVLEILKNYDA